MSDKGQFSLYQSTFTPTEAENAVVTGGTGLHARGISRWVALLFVLGAMAGAGIIALPTAFLNAGWWAVPMVVVMSIIGCLTGLQLSWCWTILQENWPEYLQLTRNPYPEIAYRAGGNFARYCVQLCVDLCMFMGAIAFLVLSSNNISHLIEDWSGVKINFCYLVIILAVILLPISFLGTPKDFWFVSVGALGATVLAIIFILIGTLIDMPKCHNKVHYPPMTLKSFISAYSTITFAYSSHAAIPTVQNDMKHPRMFPISVIVSFIALFIMYLPMPVLAYVVYGHTIQGTIDQNLSTKWIRDLIILLITGHVLFAFFIVVNPVAQDFERILGIPTKFSWKRICTRTLVIGSVVFVALSLPDFNVLLELMGGTTSAAGAYIFPGPFYLMLRAKVYNKPSPYELVRKGAAESGGSSAPKIPSQLDHASVNGAHIPLWEYALNFMVVSMGVVGAVATIYGVVGSQANLQLPCYMNNMHLERKMEINNISNCWDSTIMDQSAAFDNKTFTFVP